MSYPYQPPSWIETMHWISELDSSCQKKRFKDTKGAMRMRRTYDTMVKWKKTKGQTTIYKTPHKKVRIGQQEPTKN
jgi:hypothetical protein